MCETMPSRGRKKAEVGDVAFGIKGGRKTSALPTKVKPNTKDSGVRSSKRITNLNTKKSTLVTDYSSQSTKTEIIQPKQNTVSRKRNKQITSDNTDSGRNSLTSDSDNIDEDSVSISNSSNGSSSVCGKELGVVLKKLGKCSPKKKLKISVKDKCPLSSSESDEDSENEVETVVRKGARFTPNEKVALNEVSDNNVCKKSTKCKTVKKETLRTKDFMSSCSSEVGNLATKESTGFNQVSPPIKKTANARTNLVKRGKTSPPTATNHKGNAETGSEIKEAINIKTTSLSDSESDSDNVGKNSKNNPKKGVGAKRVSLVNTKSKNVKTVPVKKAKISHSSKEESNNVTLNNISDKKILPVLPKIESHIEVDKVCQSFTNIHPKLMKAIDVDVSLPSTSKSLKKEHAREAASSASSSESDWEEVEEHEQPCLDDYKPDIPEEGVEIILENPHMKKRYKRKKFDVNGYIRLQINRLKKDVQLALHKVHLLCFISHGMYLNETLNSVEIKGLALSLLPEELVSATKNQNKIDISIIRKMVSWFNGTFSVDVDLKPVSGNVLQQLVACFEMQKSCSASQFNVGFVAFARTLGISARLCYSLYPLNFKPKDLLKKENKKHSRTNSSDDYSDTGKSKNNTTKNSIHAKNSTLDGGNSKTDTSNKTSGTKTKNTKGKGQEKNRKVQKKKIKANSDKKLAQVSRKPRRSKQNKSYKISSDENEDLDDSDMDKDFVASDLDNKDDDDIVASDLDDKDDNYEDKDLIAEDDSDNDFQKSEISSRRKKGKSHNSKKSVSRPVCNKQGNNASKNTKKKDEKNRKILSSESGESFVDQAAEETSISGIEFWGEIFCKKEKRWIPVEASSNCIDKPDEIGVMAKQPVKYVIAFDNNSRIKDVTRRYCPQFLTLTRKLQADTEWWEETLWPFLPPNNKQDKDEDQQLLESVCNRPIPTTVTELKGHPLYVIKPHLLKYEALYPPDAAPVGFLRSEPIYSRTCVFTLHNREKWMKEARVIREGEKAYKMVKSRPKWDKINRRIIKTEELPLVEIFGEWQTEPFVPPTARDGKVPRNEYGNVELFKPEMVPKGTVHLQIPGLNRVAKKLDIDCAPALTGFDVHNLGVHPVFDGFIVCSEFEETLLAAWEEEQVNIRKREEEKRDKRIYGNWKKLIKGLLIRERIRVKYAVK